MGSTDAAMTEALPALALDALATASASLATTEPSFRIPAGLSAFAAGATALLAAAGVLGNALTALALWRSPRVRASAAAAAFVGSLCAADLLFCAAVLPFAVLRFAAGGAWQHGPALCTLLPTLRYANVGVSLLSIAMITVNRYVMIAHPAACARAYRPVPLALMVAFCWVFAFGMQLPTLFGVWGRFGYDQKLGTCSILADARGRSAKTALFVIAFLTPCAVIVACYARIFWVVHRSESRLRRHAASRGTLAAPAPGAPRAARAPQRVARHQDGAGHLPLLRRVLPAHHARQGLRPRRALPGAARAGLPAAVPVGVHQPAHLRHHEQAVPPGVQGGHHVPAAVPLDAHARAHVQRRQRKVPGDGESHHNVARVPGAVPHPPAGRRRALTSRPVPSRPVRD